MGCVRRKQTATNTQTKEPHDYTAKQLPIFNPYQILSFETKVSQATVKGVNGGADRTFPSKNHILLIQPQKNTDLIVRVNVFDQEFQNMRAYADLYGGFENTLFETKIDPSSTSRKLILIHSTSRKAK